MLHARVTQPLLPPFLVDERAPSRRMNDRYCLVIRSKGKRKKKRRKKEKKKIIIIFTEDIHPAASFVISLSTSANRLLSLYQPSLLARICSRAHYYCKTLPARHLLHRRHHVAKMFYCFLCAAFALPTFVQFSIKFPRKREIGKSERCVVSRRLATGIGIIMQSTISLSL